METKQIRGEWLEALRSGAYQQTSGALQDSDNNYCCLGVLCDLYSQHNKDGHWHRGDSGYGFVLPHYNDKTPVVNYAYPQSEVVEWVFLDQEVMSTAIIMNDAGSSFEEIADYLEAQWTR